MNIFSKLFVNEYYPFYTGENINTYYKISSLAEHGIARIDCRLRAIAVKDALFNNCL